MKVYLVLLDEHAQPVTIEMLQQCLIDLEVVAGVDEEKLHSKVAEIREGRHSRGMFLIAEGSAPVDGRDAEVEILIDVERRAGKELDDGSIDFREVNFTASVRVNEIVARHSPATRGTAGTDVRANTLEASDGEERNLKVGDNVRVEKEGGTELFISTIDGALRYENEEVSVIELLVLKGDVSFNTGNLNFGGEVVIDGSVIQGFSVKAGGDITITGTVEAGATVASRGSVTVGNGIVGRKTKVVSQGAVQAQFVQEATVMTGKDLSLGNYSYHAQLHCSGKLTISKGVGSQGGSVMGGQVWALRGIDVHIAGTKSSSETILVCGVNQEQVRKLDKIGGGLESCSEHITRILNRFGLTQIDMTQIRNMLAASTGPRRKILAHQSKQLGKLAQVYQSLLAEKKAIEDELEEISEGAEIKVKGSLFPGAIVRIGDRRRKIVEEAQGVRFHIEDDKLVER